MKRIILLLALLAAMPLGAAPAQRIVSLNLCTDMLLLELVPREHIAMLSQLVFDPLLSGEAERAKGIARFDGSVESVLELAPDLVFAGSMATLGPTGVLKRLGVRVETLDMPESIAGSLDLIETTAMLSGEPAAGIALRRATETRLEAVRKRIPASGRPLALVYLPNGLTPGAGTLKHELLELAGWRNLAAERGISGYGSLPLEDLLTHAPDLVLFDAVDLEHASMSQQLLHHPALRERIAAQRMPTQTWICAGPRIADAAEILLRLRIELPSMND